VGLQFEFGGITRAGILALVTAGLPFLAWDLLLRVRGDVDAIVLGSLLSVEAAGWWSAAQRIASIPVFVPVLVMTPLLPALAGVKADREVFARTLRRAFELTVIVTTGISAALAAFAPLVPTTLGWSPDYSAAVPLIQLSSPTLILVSISMVLGTALIALGDERRWLLANVVATVAQFVVLFAVIPLAEERLGNGAIGAAVARITAESIMLLSAQILLPRGMIGWGAWLFVARVAVVGIAATAAVLPLVERSMIVAGALWVLTYGVGLLILRVVRPSDLATVVRVTVATLRRRVRPAGP
jgi:O-antigen/teichoic acid export membrane protein